MDKRQNILDATKTLLWEKGYEATSPRDILDLSGAGQGSFYHHFRSKKELAAQALAEVADERMQVFESVIGTEAGIRKRLNDYLLQEKKPLKGCRIGRMVWDSAIKEDALREPLQRYFKYIERRLTEELEKAVARKEVRLALPARQLAMLIIAAVQGGFTVSRAMRSSRMDDAIEGLKNILDMAIVER